MSGREEAMRPSKGRPRGMSGREFAMTRGKGRKVGLHRQLGTTPPPPPGQAKKTGTPSAVSMDNLVIKPPGKKVPADTRVPPGQAKKKKRKKKGRRLFASAGGGTGTTY